MNRYLLLDFKTLSDMVLVMEFSKLRLTLIYLGSLEKAFNLQIGSDTILTGFPDAELREEILVLTQAVGLKISSEFQKQTQLIHTQLEKCQPHFEYLATAFIVNRIRRIQDKADGLNVVKFIGAEDYFKIKPRVHLPAQSPATKEALRKALSRSKFSTKTKGRLRGIKLSTFLESFPNNERQKIFSGIVDDLPTHTVVHMELVLTIYRIIADALRISTTLNDIQLKAGAAFLTNTFLIEARIPLPVKNVEDFVNEMKAATLLKYLDHKDVKYSSSFWQYDLFKRYKKNLSANHQDSIIGPISYNEDQSSEVALAGLGTADWFLFLNFLRKRHRLSPRIIGAISTILKLVD